MIPVRDPGGLPLTLRGLPPVDEVIVVSEIPAASLASSASPGPAAFDPTSPGPAAFGPAAFGPASSAPADVASIVRAAWPAARVLRAGRPGPGNALATGLAAARGDIVVTLNGDGSTDPAEIPHYVAALTAGADVAVGSRYRDSGRDLTGGRFRRWANVVLIWVVNTLFGVRRTDPGFGYAAFWRDALSRLDLPDPSSRAGAAWGDGPELGPLLALRPSIRGLRVAEVASVAYPRMSRPARAERPGPRHWIRLLTTEFPHRHGRHANAADPDSGAGPFHAHGLTSRAGSTHAGSTHAGSTRAGSTRADGSAAKAGLTETGSAGSTADLGATDAGAERHGADPRPQGEPIWGPPSRRISPSRDLWRAGENPIPHTSPRSIANVTPHAWRTGYLSRTADPDAGGTTGRDAGRTAGRDAGRTNDPDAGRTNDPDAGRTNDPDAKPRSAEDARPDPAAARLIPPQPPAAPRREVGTKRRRIEGLRQRPDLRVINGEGTGSGRTRSGRLRPVPRENLGG